MARPLHKLNPSDPTARKKGKYSDGGGLWLYKSTDDAGQWVFRFTLYGRRHEMGLGSTGAVSLRNVRGLAAKLREQVASGVNPIKARRDANEAARQNLYTLRDVTLDAFESRKAELRGDGKAGRWLSPLEIHVLPKLGKTPISEIDQRDIRDTLSPLWHTKADTARKALGRLGIVLKHGAALGLDVDLQAVEKAKALLGKTRHIATHIPAMDWRDAPAFYQGLNDGSLSHLALRLLILTALRSKPVRFARLNEIEGDTWCVPGEKMKGRRGQTADFRVPLSTEALSTIEAAKPFARDGFLFPGVSKGVISDATMARLMSRRGLEARPHGFRTTFRTWAAEAQGADFDVAETAIAHKVGSVVSRSYLRSDRIDERRELAQRWSDYLSAAAPRRIVDDARPDPGAPQNA